MIRKIGILSFNFYTAVPNYGSVLQSFALQKYLKKAGYNNEVILYCPFYRSNWNLIFPARNYKLKNDHKAKINYSFNTISGCIRYRKFQKFINKNMVKSSEEFSYKDFDTDQYDCYIMGSDTIWNIRQTKGFEKAFFGDFDCIKRCIAYAPSFGETIYSDDEINIFRKLISKFSAVSVREKVNMRAFENDDVFEALDPTLLLEAEDYDKFALVPKINKKYILIYALQNNNDVMSLVKKIAKEENLKVIEVSWEFMNKYRYGHKMKYDSGIEEWLGLIKNAEYVFTNSFHGVVFSIIYRKEFYAYTRSDAKAKIATICDKLGIKERMICTDKGTIKLSDKPIDYDAVYEKLDFFRSESKKFLLDGLIKEMERQICI
jgi:hypothetical protein